MPTIAEKPSYAVYAENMSPETAELLVEWTSTQISSHTGAAIMWYLRNQLFFEQGLDTNPRCLLVRYEKFVSRTDEQLRRICKFAGIRHLKRRAKSVFSTSVGRDSTPEIAPDVLGACEELFDRLVLAEQYGRPQFLRQS